MSSLSAVRTVPQIDRDRLLASICRDSYWDFVQTFWDVVIPEVPVWNWHIPYICDELQKVAERVFRGERKPYDLVINVPPGSTKSTLCSVMFPAWCWTRMPSFRYIGVSYSEELALDLSSKCRDVVQSELYSRLFPNIRMRSDQNTKHWFMNTDGGWRYAAGVKGTVLGKHAHAVVVDDPLSIEQAESDLERKTANRWIDTTLSTRMVDPRITPTILIMQRVHEDDPTALMLLRKNVKQLCLPAEDGPNVNPPEIRQRYVDGLLDPVRLDRAVLAEKLDRGRQFYASQFLQSPVPPGGLMFLVEKLKYGIPPEPQQFQIIVRGWDKAGSGSEKKRSSWTVGVLMGLDIYGRFWVLDVIRGRWEAFEREQIIKRTAFQDGNRVRIVIEREPGSGGLESAQATIRNLAGFRAVEDVVNATTGGKEQRADVFATQVNGGNVYLPLSVRQGDLWKNWAREYVLELTFFPNSRHSDQVDASSMAFRFLNKKRIRIGGII